MSRKLSEPIIDNPSGSGNFFSNFFNGRVLTADALNTDQLAHRQQRRLLGHAVGDGVVEGLEVKIIKAGGVGVQAVVSITKGLALNRAGQVLQLHSDEQVALVRKFDAPPPVAGAFADCVQVGTTFDTLENGAYLLVIGPASGYRERVPMRGLSDTAGVNECGSRYRVEGVQFRLARFDPALMPGLSSATRAQIATLSGSNTTPALSKLRNLLAHACFGTEELAAVAADPLKQTLGQSAYFSYGAVDFLRGRGELNDCEVPLALLFWRGATLRFVDVWAARRRVARRAESAVWPPLYDERRASLGEAMIRQFQDHADAVRISEATPEIFAATGLFRYLPPVGFLPLKQGATKGFSANAFFIGLKTRVPEYFDGARLGPLLREAAAYNPIDLTDGRMLWVYRVAENETLPGKPPPAGSPYLVFTAPHVPYQATPRFDVSRYDLSNYAKCGECVS
jgi:hypothetical protein